MQQINHVTKSSRKSYFIIDDFYVMFDKKYLKKSVNIIQKRVSTSSFQQIRIIAYFKLVMTRSINQKSINRKFQQNSIRSKTNFSKSTLVQHRRLELYSIINQQRRRFFLRNIFSLFRQILFVSLKLVVFVIEFSISITICIVIYEFVI